MKLEFKRLTEVDKEEVIDLLDHPLIARHMPMIKQPVSEEMYASFVAIQERFWAEYGYGLWAFVMDNRFVGYGGLCPREKNPELTMVLHPNSWGKGKVIYLEVIRRVFNEMGFQSVTTLLPASRTRIKPFLGLGFQPDGEIFLNGVKFFRYRLLKPIGDQHETQGNTLRD